MGEIIHFRSGRTHHPNFTSLKEALGAAALGAMDWYNTTNGVEMGQFRMFGDNHWPPLPVIMFDGKLTDVIDIVAAAAIIDEPLDPLVKEIMNFIAVETGGHDEDFPTRTYRDAVEDLKVMIDIILDIQNREVA